jgi:murein DD-endopeptidase MepM/ murein hydrolase activator NlpD
MDRNPFGELQEGQVGSVQFNAPPTEQAPDLTAVNAGQNAQALLVAGRFLNAGANQLDTMSKQRIKVLNANLKAKGQQLATSGLFDGQTMTAEEAAAAGFTDQSFLEGYLKTRADVDLQNVGYELKREAQNPNSTEQSLYALSEQRIGQLKQNYNKFGAIGSTVFSDDVYKPLLTAANEVKLDGVKRDVQAIQADQEVMSRQSLDTLFSNASGLASPEGAVVFNDAIQRQLDNAIKVHGEKGIKVFTNNLVNSAIAGVNNGADMNSIKTLLSISKVKLSNGTEVALPSLDADLTNKLFEADKNYKSAVREDRKYSHYLLKQNREVNTQKLQNYVYKLKINNPNASVAQLRDAAIKAVDAKGISNIDLSQIDSIISTVQKTDTSELGGLSERVTKAALADSPYPYDVNAGLTSAAIKYLQDVYTSVKQNEQFKDAQQDQTLQKSDQQLKDTASKPLKDLGTQILTPAMMQMIRKENRNKFLKSLDTTSNGILARVDVRTSAGVSAYKKEMDKTIDGLPITEAAKSELHKALATKVRDFKGVSSQPTTSNQSTQSPYKPTAYPQLSERLLGKRYPMTSGFGKRPPPKSGASTNHYAVDIGAPEGTPVNSYSNGTVIYAGKQGNAGNVVRVKLDNGFIVEYMHLKNIYVNSDQRVSNSNVIGEVGTTGNSTGPHLHFAVHGLDGKPIKPYL